MSREVTIGVTDEAFVEGFHLCYIYNDDREHKRTIAKFIERGLAEGDRLLCLLDKATPSDVQEYLRTLEVEAPARPDALVTGDAESTYCPGGRLQVVPLLAALEAFCRQSTAAGFRGSRITGDMSWAVKTHTSMEQLMEYELKATETAKAAAAVALCQYDARKFDGGTLVDILSVHPAMLVRGQIVRNPYYLDPREFLAQRRARGDGESPG